MPRIKVTRFYAQGAPPWWQYQLISLGNRVLPPRRHNYYSVLVDNGMFAFWKRCERPGLDKWYGALLRFVYDVERLRKPREIIVVLPDWLNDYPFTYEAATHPVAKRLCRDYVCAVVVHPGVGLAVGNYASYAEKYASIDYVSVLAAPLKLNCSRYSGKAQRRIIKLHCQAAIVEQVCSVAKRYDLRCHGLGVALKPEHVKRLIDLGLTSFDSSSWTRPNASIVAKSVGNWSAKNASVKELFFRIVVERLQQAGVELEGVEQ